MTLVPTATRGARLALPTALLSVVTLFVASPANAHHAYATFDDTRIRTLKGTIETFEWSNPHVVLEVLVKLDGRSEPQEWRIESSSPAILKRFGWQRNSMKAGDRISAVCNPLRDGSPGCRLHTLMMLDTGLILKTKLSAAEDFDQK
jgi:hypothetical protein